MNMKFAKFRIAALILLIVVGLTSVALAGEPVGQPAHFLKLWIGQSQALVDGKPMTLDAPPMLYNGRTMVPLRFIAEAMGADVQWNPTEKSITIPLPPTTTDHLGKICVVKFNDINGNGKQDNGEPALPGWTIAITDSSGNVVGTGTTNEEGYYCHDVSPGTYTVSEVLQTGWSQTYPGNPGTYTVTVKPDQTINVVFGNQEKPCCLTFQFTAGQEDKFVPGNAEPACCSCSPSVVDWCHEDWDKWHPGQNFPGFTDFDATQGNKWFAHCFILPAGNCIDSAKLTFLAKPLSGNAGNDDVTLIIGNNHWTYYFGSGNSNPGLLSSPWNTYPLQTFQLDLANLPGGVNLLSSLNNVRNLGIVIQDDTSIDYMRLEVTFCECEETLTSEPVPGAEITVDQTEPIDPNKPILRSMKCTTNDKGEFSFLIPEEEFKNLPDKFSLQMTITPPKGWTGISSSNVVTVQVEKSAGSNFEFVLLWQKESTKTNKGSFAINPKAQS